MTQNADLNRSTIHSDQNCYPCLRNKVLPMSQEGHYSLHDNSWSSGWGYVRIILSEVAPLV